MSILGLSKRSLQSNSTLAEEFRRMVHFTGLLSAVGGYATYRSHVRGLLRSSNSLEDRHQKTVLH